jgi:hypothetical protein
MVTPSECRGAVMRVRLLVLALALTGCPAPRPATGSECTAGAMSSNCGLCTSARVCVWCASEERSVVGCYDRRHPVVCPEGTVVRVPERCEDMPEEQVAR